MTAHGERRIRVEEVSIDLQTVEAATKGLGSITFIFPSEGTALIRRPALIGFLVAFSPRFTQIF